MYQGYELHDLRAYIDTRSEFFREAKPLERASSGLEEHHVPYRLNPDAGVRETALAPPKSSSSSADALATGMPIFDLGLSAEETKELLDLARGEFGEHYRSRIIDRGIDALGWYVSFHLRGAQFGIYIKVSGLAWLANHLLSFKPDSIDPVHAAQSALDSIVLHEWAHFLVDRMVLQMENAYGVPIWAEQYDKNFPLRDREEGIANAYMLRRSLLGRSRNVPPLRAAMLNFVKQQPKAYRDALSFWKIGSACTMEVVNLAYALREEITDKGVAEWERLGGFDEFPNWKDVPVILVDDCLRQRLHLAPAFIHAIERIDESKAFETALGKLGTQAATRWDKTKGKLAASTFGNGLDFKPWPKGGKGMFSVRVNSELRAHLRFVSHQLPWIAEMIGHHGPMGHG